MVCKYLKMSMSIWCWFSKGGIQKPFPAVPAVMESTNERGAQAWLVPSGLWGVLELCWQRARRFPHTIIHILNLAAFFIKHRLTSRPCAGILHRVQQGQYGHRGRSESWGAEGSSQGRLRCGQWDGRILNLDMQRNGRGGLWDPLTPPLQLCSFPAVLPHPTLLSPTPASCVSRGYPG